MLAKRRRPGKAGVNKSPWRTEVEAKICLELDWSVVFYPAVLPTPVPVSETVLHGRCGAHTKGTSLTMATMKPSTSAHVCSEAHAGERAKEAKEVKVAFNPNAVLIVHWDGYIVPESNGGRGIIGQLPVLLWGVE